MRMLCAMLAACFAAVLVGCEDERPPEQRLPKITLVKRDAAEDTITLRFRFTEMERLNWKNKVLRVGLVKSGKKPAPGGPEFKGPSPEFIIEISVGKPAGSETVFFVPMWGKASEDILVDGQPFELPLAGGKGNHITIPALAEQRISQILNTCTGPGHSVPFDPDTGIDLFTIGYLPDAWSLHVWVERAVKKPAEPSASTP